MRLLPLALAAALFALPLRAATLLDEFTFDTGLGSTQGAVTASATGTVSGGRYVFDANQGLTLTLGSPLAAWSLVFGVQLDETSQWRKLVDLSGLTSDRGLYAYATGLTYYEFGGPTPGTFPALTDLVVALVFDGTTTKTYLNGVEQQRLVATGAGFPGALSSLVMFEDDTITHKTEAASGSADWVRIYDGALSANELSGVAAVPLPASGAALLAGIAGLAALRRRRG